MRCGRIPVHPGSQVQKLPFIKDSYTVLSSKYTIWSFAQGRNRLEEKYATKLRKKNARPFLKKGGH
jgi:hypothetical protein